MRKSSGARTLLLAAILLIVLLATVSRIKQNVHGADRGTVRIKVDQVGYLPHASKLAVVDRTTATTFEVKRASDHRTMFKGVLGPPRSDADTGDSVQLADFSRLDQVGAYYVDVPGVGRSWTFSIRPDVYSRTCYLAMRAFYGQRCGTAGRPWRGVSRICARSMSSEGRVPPLVGAARRSETDWRLARCGGLRTLRRELGDHDGHSSVGF